MHSACQATHRARPQELDARKTELRAVQQELAEEQKGLRETEEGEGRRDGHTGWAKGMRHCCQGGCCCGGRACDCGDTSTHCPPGSTPHPSMRNPLSAAPELRGWETSLTVEQLQQQLDEIRAKARSSCTWGTARQLQPGLPSPPPDARSARGRSS
jgi:hypothetical protein